MKKKLLSVLLAGVMLAGLAFSAAAVNEGPDKELLPGQEQDSEMIPSPGIDPTATTDDDEIEVVTDNVVTGGYILEKGTAEPRPLGQIDYPVIKITTTDMSRDSNRKIDAANPAATDKEKSGMMTESGLSYGQNKRVNDTVDRYVGTSSTEDFVGSYEMGLFDKAVTKAESSMDNYRVIQVMDISANSLATGADKSSVTITMSAPGVKTGSRVMVARIRDNSMEFVASSAGNGTISFTVNPHNLGVYVLMVGAEG